MRVVTWNCNGPTRIGSLESSRRSFREKFDRAISLAPDILILQECPKEDAVKHSGYSLVWRGELLGRGICIAVSPQIPSLRVIGSTHSSVTVECGELAVVGIWSTPIGHSSFQKYVNEVDEAIEANHEVLATGQAIIAGDFNANAYWDQRTRKLSHTQIVNRLKSDFGLKSAYHSFFECEQGAELHPTFFMNKNEKKPFHIDYCFVPRTWRLRDVFVGEIPEWKESSDHCPLVVDLEGI